jgi:hypothetical protein
MAITVSVYEKAGLCRGRPIGNATFEAQNAFLFAPLSWTRGGPLSGTSHVYSITAPIRWPSFDLIVAAPSYQTWKFFVRDGETHEVWLTKA